MAQANSDKTTNVLQDIWQNLQLAFRLYGDPRVSLLLKTMAPVAALAYFIMPIDLLPDFIPVLGQLDEVAIILLLIRLFISLAPPEVVAEHRGEAPASAGSAGTGSTSQAKSKGPKPGREDVIDADFRVVNDA
ncbi:MAG: YkvA family protein [Anaerolineae bacterium]